MQLSHTVKIIITLIALYSISFFSLYPSIFAVFAVHPSTTAVSLVFWWTDGRINISVDGKVNERGNNPHYNNS